MTCGHGQFLHHAGNDLLGAFRLLFGRLLTMLHIQSQPQATRHQRHSNGSRHTPPSATLLRLVGLYLLVDARHKAFIYGVGGFCSCDEVLQYQVLFRTIEPHVVYIPVHGRLCLIRFLHCSQTAWRNPLASV